MRREAPVDILHLAAHCCNVPVTFTLYGRGRHMSVERIFVSPTRGAPQVECDEVSVEASRGVVGDRNFGKSLHPGQNITLVEAEEIELFFSLHERSPDLSLTRRNLITRGVRLNEFVGKEFRVGEVRLRGVELCEPCTILGGWLSTDALSSAEVIKHWVRRGGLRADVLSSGVIHRGARIAAAV